MSSDNQKVIQDSLRVVPVLKWVERHGGVSIQVEMLTHGLPRIHLCFARSKRLITALHHDKMAVHKGRSLSGEGDVSHWRAEKDGVELSWFENDPYWLAKIHRQGVTA